MAGIVVGVNGSDDAHRALSWAMREAAARQVPLTVLTINEAAASAWTGDPRILPADEALVDKYRRAAEETVAKAVAELHDPQPPSVTVRAEVVHHSHCPVVVVPHHE